MDKFWERYYRRYDRRISSAVAEDEDWEFVKWGKVILDDPFAGIWCSVAQ